MTLHIQHLENLIQEQLQQIQQRDETLRQRDLIITQRDRQLDKLDKSVTKYSATAQSIFIKGALAGLLAGLAFVFGLHLMQIL